MPQPNGGTVTPVAGLAERVARGIRYAFTGKADWFGPGAPIAPSAPEQVAGRQFQMPVSYNTLIQSKVEGVSFAQLRMLADTCDIIRLLIEVRKNQISALDWSIQKRGVLTARGKAPGGVGIDPKAERLMDFMRSPDKDHGFETWLRYLLEDMFVIDAPTLYIQRTRGGDVYALRPIDGATIKRVIDPHGWVPMPPLPAYQQILQGTAAIDYTTDELIYRPRNMRTNRIYGLSHVEQIIVTAKTWLSRQAYNLEYYDSGTTPEGFLSASKDWGVQQIAEYQELFNLQLSGQLGERRKVKVTPNDSKFTETKEPAFKNAYDEWLARIACFCFSIPPTAFVNEMSRATAGTQNIASLETGLAPLRVWVERLMSDIIQKTLEEPEYEFTFRDKEAEDPLERANIDQIYLGSGVITPNEVRADLGMAPLEEPVQPKLNPSDVPPPPEHGDGTPNPRTAVNIKHAHGDLAKAAPKTEREKKLAATFGASLAELRDSILRQWRVLTGTQDATPELAVQFSESADLSALSLASGDYVAEVTAAAKGGADQAIARVKTEIPEDMLDVRDPRAVEWADKYAASMLTSDGSGGVLADSTRNMIRETLTKGLQDKLSRDELAAVLEDAYAFSTDRADLIAVTEIGNATRGGLFEGYKAAGMQQKRWLLSNDDNVCPVCTANAAQGYIPINEPFQSGDMQPLAHPNCFIGSTAVALPGRPKAATQRMFNGNVVVIRVAEGPCITCTPNHPILTDCGWVAAGSLNVGSNVVRYIGGVRDGIVSVAAAPDHENVPPSIEQVAHALGGAGHVSASPVPVSAEDFHGDGECSDVAIIWTNGELRDGLNPAIGKDADQLPFVRINDGARLPVGGAHEQLGFSDDAPPNGVMSLARIGRALFGGHAAHADQLRLASSADGETQATQPLTDSDPVNSVDSGHGEDAFAALISFAQVAEVTVRYFSGHVYNLDTENGWYVAGGIIAHNCQCDLSARMKPKED